MMNKQNLISVLISVLVMLVLPGLAVSFVKGDNSMAVCLILFYVINPLTAAIIGISAGRTISRSWFMSFVLSALFILGVWVFFSIEEQSFLYFTGIYLTIGLAAMLITAAVKSRKSAGQITGQPADQAD